MVSIGLSLLMGDRDTEKGEFEVICCVVVAGGGSVVVVSSLWCA